MKKPILIFLVLFSVNLFSQTQQRASFEPVPTNSLKLGGYFPANNGQSAGIFAWDSGYVNYLKSIKLNGYIPNNGMALDTIQFYNRIIG